jgi:hypothetical protein
MKTTPKKESGAVKSCPTHYIEQGLATNEGALSPIEAQGEFSALPSFRRNSELRRWLAGQPPLSEVSVTGTAVLHGWTNLDTLRRRKKVISAREGRHFYADCIKFKTALEARGDAGVSP